MTCRRFHLVCHLELIPVIAVVSPSVRGECRRLAHERKESFPLCCGLRRARYWRVSLVDCCCLMYRRVAAACPWALAVRFDPGDPADCASFSKANRGQKRYPSARLESPCW